MSELIERAGNLTWDEIGEKSWEHFWETVLVWETVLAKNEGKTAPDFMVENYHKVYQCGFEAGSCFIAGKILLEMLGKGEEDEQEHDK